MANIEERVTALETQYAHILEMVKTKPDRSSWREVVGLFRDDPSITELHIETAKIREEDRKLTRDSDE